MNRSASSLVQVYRLLINRRDKRLQQVKTAAEGEFGDTTPAAAQNTNGKKPVSNKEFTQNG